MNNNCTKCGNPLQPGTTICPVCGTNNINAAPAPAAPAAPGAVPAAPAVDPATGVAVAAPVTATQQVPVQPAVPGAPVAPAPVGAAPAVDPATGAPAAAPLTATQQVPAQPAAPGAPAPAAPAAPGAKEKKPVNKKLIIIVAVAALVIVVVAVVLIFVLGQAEEPAPTPTPSSSDNLKPPAQQTSTSTVTINGFSFSAPEGWQTTTSSEGVTVYDNGPTTIVQLAHTTGDIKSVDEETIKSSLEGSGYSNVDYSETKIQDKDAVKIKATKEGSEFVFEFYYIASDLDLIGGAVVYSNAEADKNNNTNVSNIMNSLKYTETANALEDESEYLNASNMYSTLMSNGSSSGSSSTDKDTDSGSNPDEGDKTDTGTNPDSGTDEGGF